MSGHTAGIQMSVQTCRHSVDVWICLTTWHIWAVYTCLDIRNAFRHSADIWTLIQVSDIHLDILWISPFQHPNTSRQLVDIWTHVDILTPVQISRHASRHLDTFLDKCSDVIHLNICVDTQQMSLCIWTPVHMLCNVQMPIWSFIDLSWYQGHLSGHSSDVWTHVWMSQCPYGHPSRHPVTCKCLSGFLYTCKICLDLWTSFQTIAKFLGNIFDAICGKYMWMCVPQLKSLTYTCDQEHIKHFTN